MLEKILQTATTSIIAIIVLFILTRVMGKKQMAQLNFFDYVVGISIGSIASEYAVVRDVHLAEGLTALMVFTMFSLVLSYMSVKSYWGRKLLDGTPVVLIENGKILETNLKKTKITINDLLEECRQKNIFNIAEIEFAILETRGRLSILPKSQNRPLTPKDMGLATEYEGLCTNVIIDGKSLDRQLASIHLDAAWLNTQLAGKGITGCADVLLGYVDTAGFLHVHMKDKKDKWVSSILP